MNDHLSTARLIDFVHGELSPSDDALTHAHLATCAPCRDAYDLETTLSEALRAAAKAEELEMPSLVNAAVWDRIRRAEPGPLARFAAFLRPMYAVPIAVVLVAFGFFASPLGHPARPTIDASYYLEAHAAQTGQTPLSERSSGLVLETSMIAPDANGTADGTADGVASTGSVDDVR